MKHLVIIGNGISGITAARHVRKKSGFKITVISSETDHFFSRTALMYIYMGHMKYEHTKPYEDWFWEKNGIRLVRGHVEDIDTEQKKLSLDDGKTLQYDILLLALGSKPNKFGWPGEDLPGVQGLYSYQDLQNMETATQDISRAVVVGGGLIGIEMAEMLRTREIPVTMLVRENSFWNNVLPPEESAMVNRVIRKHGIDLRLNTELKEIVPDASGRAKTVLTGQGETIDCGFVGLTAGVHPNIGLLKNSPVETDKGILVNEFFETNIPGVYAIGDCVQYRNPPPGRKPVEQVWYTGKIHGETVAQTICGNPTKYQPGPWFNSAKFFDIEYQVYGQVDNSKQEDEEHLYWEHPSGEMSVRLIYDKAGQQLRGVNLMGVRYRHELCDHWIKNGIKIQEVLRNLKKANFDPEFFKQYEDDILKVYNDKNPGEPLKPAAKRGVLTRLFQ